MECSDISANVMNPARLAALRAVALLDTPTEEAFDRLTRLACRFTNSPVALVTLVDADRQFFKSCIGLPEPWLSRRETPLSHSFCQYNYVPKQPLLIEDARIHPLFKDNLAIRDLKVIAYLGIPLVTQEGYVLGSFCIIDTKPRQWSAEEVAVVEDLAAAVMTEIQLRTEHQELVVASAEREKESMERLQVLEQLRKKDNELAHQIRRASMGEMISTIAHYWRQPLNLLALLAQDLPVTHEHGQLNSEYLNSAVKKMLQTIRTMSKAIEYVNIAIRKGDIKVEFFPSEIINRALSLSTQDYSFHKINPIVSIKCNIKVNGYPDDYLQAVLNILDNARDALVFSKRVDPIIGIEIEEIAGRSMVTIFDNAGGIEPSILDRIFDPYFSTKDQGDGLGLGLYIAKVLVEENMGGELTGENAGDGARFTIIV